MLELSGLSETAAARRLASDGPNTLPSEGGRNVPAIVAGVLREPMIALLLACGAIYVFLGDKAEALLLLGFVALIIAISAVQESRTERALSALRRLSRAHALVLREGERRRIPASEIVVGDLLVLAEGDRVAADGVLQRGSGIAVDESLLTGESVPVRKVSVEDVPSSMGEPGGEDLPFVFSGTLVVRGDGIARVVATGPRSEIGRIGRSLAGLSREPTRTQREAAVVVRRLAVMAFATSALVAAVYGVTRTDWLQGLLVGITLAMAIIPEELPVVLTVFLGIGAWRIAKHNVLARRIPAVEMLGATTALCVDKTGTLTENHMTLGAMVVGDRTHRMGTRQNHIPDGFHDLVEISVLASRPDPFDPMERTLHDALRDAIAEEEHQHPDWTLVREYPLSRELLATTNAWRTGSGTVLAAKGAPEAIAQLCRLPPDAVQHTLDTARRLGEEGLRVLGVARASTAGEPPSDPRDVRYAFVGILGFSDPVRATVPPAIREAQAAGIRIIMVTGDFPATAVSVARSIMLSRPDRYATGADVRGLSEADLRDAVRDVDVFCRMTPDLKLRLVEALKANGEIVAMTGDGVNDAPALKAAHIGVAMGRRGTDVAREAAAVVVLDDDFSSIVAAIRMGRRIFDNLRKAVSFVTAAHVPIIGMSVIPVLAGWPLMLLPAHILFLQLIIDPACAVAFEAEPAEANVMRRPPRRANDPLFDRATVGAAALQGALLLAIVWTVYGVTLGRGQSEGTARALTFATMVAADLGLIIANRSSVRFALANAFSPNAALWTIVGAAVLLLAVVLTVPEIRTLFAFDQLHADDALVAAGASMAAILGVTVGKRLRYAGRQE